MANMTDEEFDRQLMNPGSVPPVTQEPVSKGESIIRGLQQGATLGFADEAAAGVYATKELLNRLLIVPKTPQEKRTWQEDYTTYRDSMRARDNTARTDNPLSYLGGNLAASVVPAAATTKLISKVMPTTSIGRQAVATNATLGGLSGLGSSEASTPKGLAIDTATGTGVGTVLGGAGQVAGKAWNKIKDISKSEVGSLNPDEIWKDALKQRFKRSVGDPLEKELTPTTESEVAKIADDITAQRQAYNTSGVSTALRNLSGQAVGGGILGAAGGALLGNDQHGIGTGAVLGSLGMVGYRGKSIDFAPLGKAVVRNIDNAQLPNWVAPVVRPMGAALNTPGMATTSVAPEIVRVGDRLRALSDAQDNKVMTDEEFDRQLMGQ